MSSKKLKKSASIDDASLNLLIVILIACILIIAVTAVYFIVTKTAGGANEGGETDTTNRTPLLEGEKEDGSSDAKEEVETGNNTGGETTQVPDADATVSGSQIPGWGN